MWREPENPCTMLYLIHVWRTLYVQFDVKIRKWYFMKKSAKGLYSIKLSLLQPCTDSFFVIEFSHFKNETNRFQGGAGKKRSILTKTHSYYTIPWVSFRERVCERCEACDAVWEYSSSVRAISSLVNHLIARVGSAPNFFHENILSQKVHEFDFIFYGNEHFLLRKKINI